MNVLILTETFSKGGLETHINTYYEELKKDHNIYFGIANYRKSHYLKDAKIYTNFKFNRFSTTKEFIKDVKAIIDIIIKKNIDIVHVHPFYSIFPAIFACNITNTKLIYTLHGRSSLNFIDTDNATLLYEYALENVFSKNICVSKTIEQWIEKYKTDTIFIPNIVNENEFTESKICLQKKWALISRLDLDKCPEIIKFINIIDDLDIESLDIYGSGTEEENLRKYIKDKNIKTKIEFKGYIDNINSTIHNKYTGIVGIGRVALESLTKNLPTILIGYGKIMGVIDKNLYDKIKNINFIPGDNPEITTNKLSKQLNEINIGKYDKYQLRDIVINEFGISLVEKYISCIEESKYKSNNNLVELYKEINDKKYKDEIFYESPNIFYLLIRFIGIYSFNIDLKKTINNRILIEQKDYKIYQLTEKVVDLTERVVDLERKISSLEYINECNVERFNNLSNIGLITLLKRDVKKIIKKLKNKCYKK